MRNISFISALNTIRILNNKLDIYAARSEIINSMEKTQHQLMNVFIIYLISNYHSIAQLLVHLALS